METGRLKSPYKFMTDEEWTKEIQWYRDHIFPNEIIKWYETKYPIHFRFFKFFNELCYIITFTK